MAGQRYFGHPVVARVERLGGTLVAMTATYSKCKLKHIGSLHTVVPDKAQITRDARHLRRLSGQGFC
jgi:hypothetical protein